MHLKKFNSQIKKSFIMKSQSITLASRSHDPDLEESIKKKHEELKELARKNAKHHARRNLPDPADDTLAHYVGDLKSGYEKMAAENLQRLQPAAHFPEAKMDAEYFREKVANLNTEITAKENQNQTDEYELGSFNPGTIPLKIRMAVISSMILFVGEVLYNAKSFQLIVENLLLALVLSISISFAVLAASHFAAFLYKESKTKFRRGMVVVCSLSIIIIVFIAIALIRTKYLEGHDVHLNPFYFVVFNLFFFIVSSLLSFFILPTWTEVKQEFRHIKLHYAVKKRKEEIEQLKSEIEKIKEIILERTKHRIRIGHYSNYFADTIRKMYYEAVEIFKSTNLIHRSDRKTPACFSDALAEPNIDDISFTMITANGKS